jgi:hypothetical protein
MTLTIIMRLGLTTHTRAPARFSAVHSPALRTVKSLVCILLMYIIRPRFFSSLLSTQGCRGGGEKLVLLISVVDACCMLHVARCMYIMCAESEVDTPWPQWSERLIHRNTAHG